jgi:hypothetical protein
MPQLSELIDRVAPMGQVYLNSQSDVDTQGPTKPNVREINTQEK